ncbi:hypothetical protein D7030_15050 [Flavobacteriaceae bacterium AU392]|nr:hypothetical protein D1817_03440 [Flavobacteriaceae bacterium]RKM81612.1 hypothetical protein D7030_15050 [Flavobacteriaceae bacterium AU392]
MRYLFVLIMSVLSYQISYSQIYEVGVFLGGSNFIGDVGRTNFISPNQFAFGGIVKWNRSPRHSWRLSLLFSDIEAIDTKSDDPRREQRGLSFNSNVFEASAGLEFTFLDFNLHDDKTKFTPYLYSGISLLSHEDFYFDNGGNLIDGDSSNLAIGIPLTLGIKTRFAYHFILAAEIGARYTFSDNIDGSDPSDSDLASFRFGNINNNDWYVFSGITLTYTFGRKPCYCND